MTVRNHRLFDNSSVDPNNNDDKEIFRTAKDELDLLSDGDEESPEEDKIALESSKT